MKPASPEPPTSHALLPRQLGVSGTVVLGLGSIVGTGVFVSLALAAGEAGSAVLPAIVLAAGVAWCNGLNSAQLAASHPVSGGTYEYGCVYLSPLTGFVAGWMFLCAKAASAATASLGLAGYVLHMVGAPTAPGIVPVALVMVALLGCASLVSIQRSNMVNMAAVAVTIGALGFLIFVGAPQFLAFSQSTEAAEMLPTSRAGWAQLLHASAWMFVAYTGYGRIATLGEEVLHPRQTIPLAMAVTLLISMAIYLGVAAVAVATMSPQQLAAAARETAAPLEGVAARLGVPAAQWAVSLGAVTAMVSVLLNLILGLSRMLLAMARRGDMPASLARLNRQASVPVRAVVVVVLLIAALVSTGDVRLTWSFSALTILLYYCITNLAALRIDAAHRMYPRWLAWVGLASCGLLALWVDRWTWIAGATWIAVGLVWRVAWRRSGAVAA
ncbi:MAG: APC family permease, partial [Planctomycetota bacterium]